MFEKECISFLTKLGVTSEMELRDFSSGGDVSPLNVILG